MLRASNHGLARDLGTACLFCFICRLFAACLLFTCFTALVSLGLLYHFFLYRFFFLPSVLKHVKHSRQTAKLAHNHFNNEENIR